MKLKTSVSLMVALVLGLITAKVGTDLLKNRSGVRAGRVVVAARLRDGDQTIAKTVVENVKVIAVGRTKSSSSSGVVHETGPVRSVTLIVKPKDATRIELANNEGRPRLVLRGNADTTT